MYFDLSDLRDTIQDALQEDADRHYMTSKLREALPYSAGFSDGYANALWRMVHRLCDSAGADALAAIAIEKSIRRYERKHPDKSTPWLSWWAKRRYLKLIHARTEE